MCTARCSTARARRTGRCAPTACRAWTPRGAGRCHMPPRPLASPSTTSGPTTSRATCRGSTTASGVTWHARSSGNPWILGFDPFNEPFSTSLIRVGDEHFDAQLECFYTGTARVGIASHGAPALRCPRHDPAKGVVPTILAGDPSGLIFDEPDNYASRGFPTFIGPMDLPNLVFNVHIYCGARSPVTGNPTNIVACAVQDAPVAGKRAEDRPEMASVPQPGGPAWFVSEFGATRNPLLVGRSRRRWTPSRSGGPTGPGSTTATRPGAQPSRS